MADNPKDKKPVESKPQGGGVDRRTFLVGAGTGVAGLVVGGAVGYKVIPQPEEPTLPLPKVWIGRNVADCMGCRFCEFACSLKKENKIQPGISRIAVHQFYPGVDVPVACYQCGENAKCIEACPVDALSVKAPNLAIQVDTKKCLRTTKNGDCTLCLDKCPGSAVAFHPTTREPLICDLCDGDPACTKACVKGVISNNGTKLAAIKPAEIGAALAKAYVVKPVKTGATPGTPQAMADDGEGIG